MVNDTKKDAVRRELVQLLEGLDCYRTWRISCIERDKGPVTQDDLNQVVLPGAMFLQAFDGTNGLGGSAIVKEVRQWYAHTASDLLQILDSGIEAWAADARQFLDNFQRDFGFDFLAEAGLLRKLADKALRSRKVSSQGTYDALRELENDLSQTVVSWEELTDISALLREFENGVNAG